MYLMFFVFCSKNLFFKCLQHFFQVDMEPFIEKNIGIRYQRVGMDYGRENDKSKKFLSHAENLLSMDIKRTVQNNASVKSINLEDVQSYVDALEIATIELVFNDFYSIVFFSKQ